MIWAELKSRGLERLKVFDAANFVTPNFLVAQNGNQIVTQSGNNLLSVAGFAPSADQMPSFLMKSGISIGRLMSHGQRRLN